MATRTISDAEAATTYCSLMTEVKGRLATLDAVHSKRIDLGNDLARLEFCALLLRKSLEQIAIGSLVSNRDAFCAAYDQFETCWNAELILADIERVNPHFYPQPVEIMPVAQPGQHHLRGGVIKEFLTRKDFVKVYGKCASLLHAANPYGRVPDLGYFDKQIPLWAGQIARLLEKHLLTVAGSGSVYLIQMHETDGRVHHYILKPATPDGLQRLVTADSA
jgi:hypothetical protein